MHWLLPCVAVCLVAGAMSDKPRRQQSDEITSSYATAVFELPQSALYSKQKQNRRQTPPGGAENLPSINSLLSGQFSPNQQFTQGFVPGNSAQFSQFQTGAAFNGGHPGFPIHQNVFGVPGFQQGQLGLGASASNSIGVFGQPQFGNLAQHQQQSQVLGTFPQFRHQLQGGFPIQQPFQGNQNQVFASSLGLGQGAVGGSPMFLPNGGGFNGQHLLNLQNQFQFNQPHFAQQHFGGVPNAGMFAGAVLPGGLQNPQFNNLFGGFGSPNFGLESLSQGQIHQNQQSSHFQGSSNPDKTARSSYSYSSR